MEVEATTSRGRKWIRRSIFVGAVLALIVVLVVVVVIHMRQSAVAAVPAGWQEITPEAGKTLTSYAMSQATPGLIVAAVGDFTGNRSEDVPGPAQLWRTRDGGQHWQALPNQPPLPAGGTVAMIAGSQETVLLEADEYAPSPRLFVSHDAGDTWKALALPAAKAFDPFALYMAMSQGVYRDGKLYAIVNNAFAVSADDGVTWTPLTALPTSSTRFHAGVLSITPDYHAPNAWFRLIDARQPNDALTVARLEHSGDNGHTWSPITTIQPGNTPYMTPQMPLAGQIATQPTQPGRLCLALSVPNDSNVHAASSPPNTGGDLAGIMTSHVPYMPRLQLFLASSGDAGQTWHYSVIDQADHGGGDLITPLVSMDAHGDCYAATSTNGFISATVTSTIWHLAATTNAPAQPLAAIIHYSIAAYMVQAGADAQSWQLFLVETPNTTGYSVDMCYQNQPCYVHHDQPHLIWRVVGDR